MRFGRAAVWSGRAETSPGEGWAGSTCPKMPSTDHRAQRYLISIKFHLSVLFAQCDRQNPKTAPKILSPAYLA